MVGQALLDSIFSSLPEKLEDVPLRGRGEGDAVMKA
jgi:hypothetical protein